MVDFLLAATAVLCLSHVVHGTNPYNKEQRLLRSLPSVNDPIDKPYGTWISPITSEAITTSSVRLGGLHHINISGKDHLYWLEGRPEEDGRYVLVRLVDDPNFTDSNPEDEVIDLTPKNSNVRTRVHEYGGGAVVFGKNESEMFYSEFVDQRLYHLSVSGGESGEENSSSPVTVEGGRYRFADGVLSQDGTKIFCVREDHEKPEPENVVNEIVSVDVTDGSMTVIATGNDFYAAPRLSPDGKKLAYITWNFPNMPWDATELRETSVDGSSSSETAHHSLVAGEDGDTSIIQPLWHPETGNLYYISDQSGFYNIYRAGFGPSILPMNYDFGGSSPGWRFGQQGFRFLQDGRLVAQFNKGVKSVLVVADISNVDTSAMDILEFDMDDGLPMLFGGIVPGSDNDVYFIGGSASTSPSIYKWNIEKKGPATVLKSSSELTFPEDMISIPTQIEYPSTLGTVYAFYYPPKNGKYVSTTDDAPPVIVKSHGGPTASTSTGFSPVIQYWTSRGFAILDVNYGGSTGYGREYRNRLRNSWGVVDVDDVSAGAAYLVQEGLADGDRLCIDGGSAGGYTTLSALAFRDVFSAGTSLYGVGNLTSLALDTHKFESHYLDGLIGVYPEDEQIYKDRSPIYSVDSFSAPILLLQGTEDKIVPPNQAETMYQALLEKGIPTALKLYEGEQHGFRKAENIQDALDSELAFYGRVFGMDIPGAIGIEVQNLDEIDVHRANQSCLGASPNIALALFVLGLTWFIA